MIKVTSFIYLNESEIEISFIRSPGPGGQNVNKVATAALLRFDAQASPVLSEIVRSRLQVLAGTRMTSQGELVIKASRYRTQERNKQDAINRLIKLIQQAANIPKKRKKTKPTYASKQKRLSTKKLLSKLKVARHRKFNPDD
jgi:ribosome-associated protein